ARPAGDDGAGHQFADPARHQLGTVLRQGADDVAFGQDAINALAVGADNDRADALVVQQVDRFGDRRIGWDRGDPIAFVAQYRLDVHRRTPEAGERPLTPDSGVESRSLLPKIGQNVAPWKGGALGASWRRRLPAMALVPASARLA